MVWDNRRFPQKNSARFKLQLTYMYKYIYKRRALLYIYTYIDKQIHTYIDRQIDKLLSTNILNKYLLLYYTNTLAHINKETCHRRMNTNLPNGRKRI